MGQISIRSKAKKEYSKVIIHRQNCVLWGHGFCLDCFGGGFHRFLNNVGVRLEDD